MINNHEIGYATNFSVGDIVTVRHDLRYINDHIGVMIIPSMYQWTGKQLRIISIGTSSAGRFYRVKENEYGWQDHMLEPVGNIDMTAMDSLLL